MPITVHLAQECFFATVQGSLYTFVPRLAAACASSFSQFEHSLRHLDGQRQSELYEEVSRSVRVIETGKTLLDSLCDRITFMQEKRRQLGGGVADDKYHFDGDFRGVLSTTGGLFHELHDTMTSYEVNSEPHGSLWYFMNEKGIRRKLVPPTRKLEGMLVILDVCGQVVERLILNLDDPHSCDLDTPFAFGETSRLEQVVPLVHLREHLMYPGIHLDYKLRSIFELLIQVTASCASSHQYKTAFARSSLFSMSHVYYSLSSQKKKVEKCIEFFKAVDIASGRAVWDLVDLNPMARAVTMLSNPSIRTSLCFSIPYRHSSATTSAGRAQLHNRIASAPFLSDVPNVGDSLSGTPSDTSTHLNGDATDDQLNGYIPNSASEHAFSEPEMHTNDRQQMANEDAEEEHEEDDGFFTPPVSPTRRSVFSEPFPPLPKDYVASVQRLYLRLVSPFRHTHIGIPRSWIGTTALTWAATHGKAVPATLTPSENGTVPVQPETAVGEVPEDGVDTTVNRTFALERENSEISLNSSHPSYPNGFQDDPVAAAFSAATKAQRSDSLAPSVSSDSGVSISAGDDAKSESSHSTTALPPPPPVDEEIAQQLASVMQISKSDSQSSFVRTRVPSLHLPPPREVSYESDNLIIHIHGGGFISMSSFSHESYTRTWANICNAPVVSIDYRVAPEHPYPIPVEECFASYKWIVSHAHKLNSRAKRIILCGDSAGGNLAMVTVLRCIAEGIRLPDALVLSYPTTLMSDTPSAARLMSLMDPMVNSSFLMLCQHAYMDGISPAERMRPFLSPITVDDAALARFPRTFLHCGSCDPLFDDALALWRRMERMGCDIQFDVVDGLAHGHLNLQSQIPESKKAVHRIADWMKKVFDGNLSPRAKRTLGLKT